MTNLITSRLSLVPLTRSMMERRLVEDEFELWIADAGMVVFPGSWPGDALVMFPTLLSLGQDPVDYTYVAVDRRGRRVVGQVGNTHPVDEDGRIEIGYGFGVPGEGYATEAVAAFVAELLTRPDINAVTAHTATWNRASERVLEKNGFQRTGTSWDDEDGDQVVWERRVD